MASSPSAADVAGIRERQASRGLVKLDVQALSLLVLVFGSGACLSQVDWATVGRGVLVVQVRVPNLVGHPSNHG